MALTHVTQPLRVGPVELRNRVVRPAHVTMLSIGNGISEDLIAYHEARAKGGAALIVVEVLGVHPTTCAPLNAFDSKMGETYPKLVERVKRHGTMLFQQLWHGGHNQLFPSPDGSPPWSASDIPGAVAGVTPKPMTKAMIDETVAAFVAAAQKCEAWGVDGVELHCAHGYLPAQFLSLNANKRTDEYGGSLENRARFIRELLTAVRSSVSKKTVVGIRVAPDATTGGAGVQEYKYVVQELERLGLIDYVNISLGNYQSFPKMIGGMHESMGYELETSVPIARSVSIPSMVVGRFRTLEEADQIIRAGDADMVGFVRAMIADPDLVEKTLKGEAERVRPCIACNQACVGGIFNPLGPRLGCTVNPAAGFEATLGEHLLSAAAPSKHIMVIGGGPAGMEAARVAAIRGHKVTLVEAQPGLGGAVNIAAMAPTRSGIRDIAVWQEEELYRAGVEIRLNTYAEPAEVILEKPDAVIVATGSLPRMDGIQLSNPGEPIAGINEVNALSSHDLFLDPQRNFGASALVIDDVGHYEGIACAEFLTSKGVSVTYVSRHISFAPLMETSLMTEPALQRLYKHKFSMRLRSRVVEVGSGYARVQATFLGKEAETEKLSADTLVFVSHNQPNDEIAKPLLEAGIRVQVVGDANSPRFLPSAIREGYIAGSAI